MAGRTDKSGGIAGRVTDAVKGAASAVADAATRLVGSDDSAEDRAEEFAARAEAHRDKVEDEAARQGHARCVEMLVPSFASMPQNGPFMLRFGTGETFLDGAIDVAPDRLKADLDGRALYRDPVDFPPEGEGATVTEAWLIAASGETCRCEIAPGLQVGAGRHARVPAENLIF
jgi:hypothetical protein